jgi:hypothetical protein
MSASPNAVSSVFDAMGEVEPAAAPRKEKKSKKRKDWVSDDSDSQSEIDTTDSSDFSDDSESDDSDFGENELKTQKPRPTQGAKAPRKPKKARVEKPKAAGAKAAKRKSEPEKLDVVPANPPLPKTARPKSKSREARPKEAKPLTLNTLCSSGSIKFLLTFTEAYLPDTSGGGLLFGIVKPMISRFQNCINETGRLSGDIFAGTVFMRLPDALFLTRADPETPVALPSLADVSKVDFASKAELAKLFGEENLRPPDEQRPREELLLEACSLALLAVYSLRGSSPTLRSGVAEFHFAAPTDLVSPPPLVLPTNKHATQNWGDAGKLLYDIESLMGSPTQLATCPLLTQRLASDDLAPAKMTSYFSMRNALFAAELCRHPLVAFFVTLFQYTYSRTTARSASCKVELGAGEYSKPLSSGEK